MSGRKLRLEFPGACYHVINRGNYRSDVFETDGAKAAFETTLFAACAKSGWLLHAYVIMRNHYHLAIETPAGNLVAGMHWLQTTYANRFNRFRRENGHVFQGRYKALLVEGGATLGNVCHYIHLNPARAHIVPVEQLDDYRYSSFWFLRRRSRRPSWFRLQNALIEAGGLADTPSGWAGYAEYLRSRLTGQLSTRSTSDPAMSRGWVIGSDDFKAALLKDHALIATARAWECRGAQEIRERTWEETTA